MSGVQLHVAVYDTAEGYPMGYSSRRNIAKCEQWRQIQKSLRFARTFTKDDFDEYVVNTLEHMQRVDALQDEDVFLHLLRDVVALPWPRSESRNARKVGDYVFHVFARNGHFESRLDTKKFSIPHATWIETVPLCCVDDQEIFQGMMSTRLKRDISIFLQAVFMHSWKAMMKPLHRPKKLASV